MCPDQTVGMDTGQVTQNEYWIFTVMVKNAESNAELKGLDGDSLVIEYIQVNNTPKIQHRT